jgi:hypothetical protein
VMTTRSHAIRGQTLGWPTTVIVSTCLPCGNRTSEHRPFVLPRVDADTEQNLVA